MDDQEVEKCMIEMEDKFSESIAIMRSGYSDAKKQRRDYCLWEWDGQRRCHDTECGKWILAFESESPAKYCPFCGGVITAM